jgi:hypothetical protein
VKRRLALSVGALVAAVSFSSCTSVGSQDTVAEVNGRTLTAEQLNTLAGNVTDGETIRATLTTWIEVVAVTDDATGIATSADLTARKQSALTSLLEQFSDAGQATYELGLDGSPLLCLAAIPLDPSVPATQVLDEIAAGSTFAEAAGTYSSDAALAKAGGVVSSQDGAECLPTAQFNPDLIAAMNAAGPAVGEPAAIKLQSQEVVILLRPFADLTLTDAEKLQLSANELGTALRTSYDTANITVDARVGKWNPTDARVVPVGEG